MEKEYILKSGGFYLNTIYVNEIYPETDFLDHIEFTSNKERALRHNKEKAEYLQKILYINLGIDLVIEEVK